VTVRDYDKLPVAQWTPAEARHHTQATFDACARMWPDLMEPYANRLLDELQPEERQQIMRQGLRETIKKRFPLRGEAA
jgi:hypothetical protein